jgi:glycosyltransferase involved in cell wall biosynthesis
MRVFMISFDRALVGEGGTDAVARHRRYAEQIDKLSIVVVTPPGKYPHLSLGKKLEVYPTDAKTLWGHARAIGGYFFSVRKHEGIDLLVAQDLAAPVALALRLLSKTPLIISVHGYWWDAWFSRKRWWHRAYLPLLTWTLKRADAVRVVSRGLKELLAGKGVKPARITVIPTPVSLSRFLKDPEKKEPRPPDAPLVVAVGRLEKEKGFEVLIAAWARVVRSVPAARLFIAGDGTERVKLRKLAIDLRLTPFLHFLGALAPDELPSLYHKAVVCALASESESFGKVLVEAGAAGVPCVATATKGASEIILEGKTGYLVPIGGKEKLADRIVGLLQDPATARAMGNEARIRCMSLYDGEKVTGQVIKLWRKVARVRPL